MDSHRVSVIIPTLNRAFSLARSVDSVLGQTYTDIEIIIVNGPSTDDSFDVIQPYLKDPRVRYIQQKTLGLQAARIIGIKNALGDYIAFLDSDDEWLPDSIEVRLAALQKNDAGRALVYGDVIKAVNGREISHQYKRLNGYSYPYLLKELSLCHPSTMLITKECFEVARYCEDRSPSWEGWEDDYLALSIGKHFPVIHCGLTVAIVHGSPDSMWKNAKLNEMGCRRMVRTYREDIIQVHGRHRLFLWYLRILRCKLITEKQKVEQANSGRQNRFAVAYDRLLSTFIFLVTRSLSPFFDHIYS